MPWLLFSYLAARGDDEAPLAIPTHVAVMCGLTPPLPVRVPPHTYNGSADGPRRGAADLGAVRRHYLLIWLSGPVLLQLMLLRVLIRSPRNARLYVGLMGRLVALRFELERSVVT